MPLSILALSFNGFQETACHWIMSAGPSKQKQQKTWGVNESQGAYNWNTLGPFSHLAFDSDSHNKQMAAADKDCVINPNDNWCFLQLCLERDFTQEEVPLDPQSRLKEKTTITSLSFVQLKKLRFLKVEDRAESGQQVKALVALPGLIPKHPYGSSQESLIPLPKTLISSSGLCRHQTHMWCTDIYAGKTPNQVKKKQEDLPKIL